MHDVLCLRMHGVSCLCMQVLLKLLMIKVPVTEADSIRALACKVLPLSLLDYFYFVYFANGGEAAMHPPSGSGFLDYRYLVG